MVVQAFIPETGKGIQGATSHCLGQNFAKMFDIKFQREDKEEQHVWQTSWGCTTRTLGVMVMTHSDDKGLVIPPRVARTQVRAPSRIPAAESTGLHNPQPARRRGQYQPNVGTPCTLLMSNQCPEFSVLRILVLHFLLGPCTCTLVDCSGQCLEGS